MNTPKEHRLYIPTYSASWLPQVGAYETVPFVAAEHIYSAGVRSKCEVICAEG